MCVLGVTRKLQEIWKVTLLTTFPKKIFFFLILNLRYEGSNSSDGLYSVDTACTEYTRASKIYNGLAQGLCKRRPYGKIHNEGCKNQYKSIVWYFSLFSCSLPCKIGFFALQFTIYNKHQHLRCPWLEKKNGRSSYGKHSPYGKIPKERCKNRK